MVRLPWAEPHGRFTALFERLAIDWLKAASQKAVADQLGLSWDECMESWNVPCGGDCRDERRK